MDDKKWLDMIRTSAEDIPVPESLEPENIQKMLEKNAQKQAETKTDDGNSAETKAAAGKDTRKNWRRYLLRGLEAAAAVAIVFAAGHRVGVMQGMPDGRGEAVLLSETEAVTEKLSDSEADMTSRKAAADEMEEMTDRAAAADEMEEMSRQEETASEKTAVGQERAEAGEGMETAADIAEDTAEDAAEEGLESVGNSDILYAKLKEHVDEYEMIYNYARGPQTLEMAAEESAVAYDSGSSVSGYGGSGQTNDFSQTNLRDAGVDESDIVKTDGEYLYIIKRGSSVRIVEADGTELTEITAVESDDLSESIRDLYIDGDTMILVTGGSRSMMKQEEEDVYTTEYYDYARVLTYDISDRAEPKLLGSAEQEGYYSSSRKAGNDIYLFTEFRPQIGESQDDSRIMPLINGESMAAANIYVPDTLQDTSYLVIGSVNIGSPDKIENSKAVVSGVEQFYVSSESIYICNRNWRDGSGDRTEVLKFFYKNGEIKGVGSCEFKGYLNDTFSIDEYNGYLRVLATNWTDSGETNALYVYDEQMKLVGKIEDIAPDETIRSARFLGDTGYFVTFRQTDPLFSVDLSDPENPQIIGALKIDGFSSYLHFYGEDKLLGIGYDANPETGVTTGMKLSMFDISDPENVTELKRFVLKDANNCPGLYNYKAIMIDPEKNLFGFACDTNYLLFSYDEERGFINHLTYNMSKGKDSSYGWYEDVRGLYIEDTFYLADADQILAFDLEDFSLKTKLEL